MKGKLTIIVLTMLIKLCIYAQIYKPFPTDSATWGFYNTGPTGNGSTKEIIKGDTLLGGNSYHKVYSHTNALIGFYRESLKKIFAKVISYADTSEILVYDYNLNVGDTFYDKRTAPFVGSFVYKYLLNSISTTTLTSDIRKQYNFSWVGYQGASNSYTNLGNACNYYFVEGIGSIKGIFNNRVSITEGTECYQAALISNASYSHLKCFEHKSIQYMLQNCLILYTDVFDLKNLGLKINPNPFTNQLTINSNSNDLKKLMLTNNLGQIVYTSEFNQNSIILNALELQSGLYIATIYSNNQLSLRTKLVKE